MVTGERGMRFVKVSVYNTTCVIECYKSSLFCPHLKLLSELQVDVVHLGDGDVVILSLLLVQQLVPERGKKSLFTFL